jgi:phosphoglycerate dehydrogenase-like enzyme
VLLLAPHEFSDRDRAEICAVVPWSWVHLSSAGSDFLDLSTWPGLTLLTRSWRCYAAPLAEYALHAMLSREWAVPPWSLAETRPAAGIDRPPVPEAVDDEADRGLSGARVGVAGWGAVGRRIGSVAQALGAEVVVFRRRGRPASPGITATSDLRVVVDVDHLVIALPLTPSTHGLFDAEVLGSARIGLHLVNVARPQLLDQDALIRRCADGLMAATLDVTDPEPLPPDHPLRSLASVRLSPHVAWRSRSSSLGFINDFTRLAGILARNEPPPTTAWCAGDATLARSILSAQPGGTP